jgi:PAS domain S-box-containing protein
MKKPLKILLLEDKPSDAKLIQLELRKTNKEFECRVVQDKKNFLKELKAFQPDLILSDYSMPQFTGLDALDIAKKKCPEIPFIIVTDSLNEETAVKCIRWGAWDYVIKDKLVQLGNAVKNAIKLKAENERIKQEKQALKESEEKYHGMVMNLMEGFYIATLDGKLLVYNTEFIRILGLDPNKDHTGIELPDFWQDPEERKDYIEELIKYGFIKSYIINAKKSDGEKIVLQANSRLIKDEEGRPSRIEGVLLDITKHKEAEEKLQKEMNFNKTLLQASPAFFVAISKEGKTIMANNSMLKALGYKQKEIVGKDYIATFVPEKDREMLSKIFKKLVKKKEPTLNENCIITKDGKELLVEWHGRPVFKENGEYDFFFGVGIDITERNKAEEALRESEKRFKHLVKNSNDVIVIIDENGKETYVSDSVERITGFSPAEVLNHSGFEFLHPDDVDHMSKTLSKLLKTPGGTIKDEYRHKRKDGGWVYLEAIGANYLHEPSIKGIILNIRDITERKKSEEELNRNFQQQKLLTEVSYLFTKLGKFDENMKEAIRMIGEYSGVSRVYVFENFNNGEFTKNTYEWCNKNIEPQIDNLQELPYKMIPSHKKFLVGKGMVLSSNILELPQDMIDLLEPQNIKSIFILPIYVKDQFFGFMGFDDCEKHRIWDKSEIELLNTVTNIISTLFERKLAEEDIKKRNEELEIFNRMAVGREMKMIELKKEINSLLEKAGEKPAYEIVE